MEEEKKSVEKEENIQGKIEKDEEEKIQTTEEITINEDDKINKEKIETESEEENETADVEKDIEKKELGSNEFKTVEYQVKEKKSHKKLVIVVIVVILLLFLSTIFAILNIDNNNIINGIYIEKVNFSNLSGQEATEVISKKIEEIQDLEIEAQEYETVVKLEELGININYKDAMQKAMSYGKSNNILLDNYSILKANLFKEKLKIDITIDEEKFNDMANKIQAEIPGAVKQYSYEIIGNELIISPGTKGLAIDKQELKQLVIDQIKEHFNGNEQKINLKLNTQEPTPIDIEKIYEEIHSEAKNAYIEEDPFVLHKDENGIDFDISIEEAKELLTEQKDQYIIPLNITEAEVRVKDLGDKLFKQNLSKFTTIYDAGNTNRASNIALAAKTINGIILLPGEEFSYNKVLGNTTKEKGYKLGGAYVGGKVVQAYGGGICQVSTTLYNAVLYANLEIVERYNHSYAVSYVPAGRDATVSYGGKDFKFKNTRNYPIRIDANAKNGVVSVSITGIKEEKEYEIELTSTVLSTIPFETTYEKTGALNEGQEKVIQKGHKGQTSAAYKIIKYNNQVISKTLLSKDTYKPMNKIVQVGTKKTVQTATESVQEEKKEEAAT